MSVHCNTEPTTHRHKTSWWWPSFKTDITWHIRRCPGCQKTRKSDTKPAPLAPLPAPRAANVGVHADVFGPLKCNSGYKHVLCMTDAFSKIAEVVPIPTKKPPPLLQASSIIGYTGSLHQSKYTLMVGRNLSTIILMNFGHSGTESTPGQPGLTLNATRRSKT